MYEVASSKLTQMENGGFRSMTYQLRPVRFRRVGPSQTLHFDTNEPNDDLASLSGSEHVPHLGNAMVWMDEWMDGWVDWWRDGEI